MTQLTLGIETSCDETAAALYDAERGLLGHALYSQTAHAAHGGVVPELASRDHVRKLIPMIRDAAAQAQRNLEAVTGVAYTAGPGLAGALLAGTAAARSLAYALGVPGLGVHHMEAHLLAPMLEENPPTFPFVALLVSGGHTQLVAVTGVGRYRLLGTTLDDAAGEAFDKVAKLLGLAYPGGPAVARAAEHGDPQRYQFPRPMTDRPGLDFSFSGLKTHVVNTFEAHAGESNVVADIAAGFEAAVADTLIIKCRRAVAETGFRRLVVAGGVGANQRLRASLAAWAADSGVTLHFPRLSFCTDNAAMVAYCGHLRLAAGESTPLAFEILPRWSLESLSPPGQGERRPSDS